MCPLNQVEQMDLKYETRLDPPRESLAPIERGLHEFNRALVGRDVTDTHHRVVVLVKDEAEAVVGGVYGDMFWDWLHVKTLWVAEGYRGRGVGTALLERIEEAAVSQGVYGSHLETTDFQALGFYLKNGYEVFGKLEGKPAGHTWYYVKKELGGA